MSVHRGRVFIHASHLFPLLLQQEVSNKVVVVVHILDFEHCLNLRIVIMNLIDVKVLGIHLKASMLKSRSL